MNKNSKKQKTTSEKKAKQAERLLLSFNDLDPNLLEETDRFLMEHSFKKKKGLPSILCLIVICLVCFFLYQIIAKQTTAICYQTPPSTAKTN